MRNDDSGRRSASQAEHYPAFDTANKNGKHGTRLIYYLGHIKMMAAAQPFLSGAISKTINMPNEATVDDIKVAYEQAWKLGLKSVALYRDGCKLSQPLAASVGGKGKGERGREDKEKAESKIFIEEKTKTKDSAIMADPMIREALSEADDVADAIRQASELLSSHTHASPPMESYSKDGTVTEKRVYLHGEKRPLPAKRGGITVAAKIAGKHQLWLRTGEYPDGKLAEIFIDMYKEGSAFSSMLNMFAISISMGLQHGVPLEKLVDNFTFTRFEPSGMTDHPNVKICTSPIDFVFRILGMEYLGRMDFVQVKPKGIQKNKFENIARLAQSNMTQETIDLGIEFDKKESIAHGQVELPVIGSNKQEAVSAIDISLGEMMGDAPACPTCGHTTVRNGSCFKCLNCGDSLGCS